MLQDVTNILPCFKILPTYKHVLGYYQYTNMLQKDTNKSTCLMMVNRCSRVPQRHVTGCYLYIKMFYDLHTTIFQDIIYISTCSRMLPKYQYYLGCYQNSNMFQDSPNNPTCQRAFPTCKHDLGCYQPVNMFQDVTNLSICSRMLQKKYALRFFQHILGCYV